MQVLDGQWWLAPDPDNVGRTQRWFESGPVPGAQPAAVPGIIQMTFPRYHGVAWYWHRFAWDTIPDETSRAELHFLGGVDYLADVWLNGQFLGSHEGGECPFDLDATAALQPDSENLLVVRVLNPTHEPIDGYTLRETPHSNKAMPYRCGTMLNFGGIRSGCLWSCAWCARCAR